MPGNFGCFRLAGNLPDGDAAGFAYALASAEPGIERAWAHLTGRLENPRGGPMFRDGEDPLHVAAVHRLIRAHAAFGGEDLLFVFDREMRLLRVDRGADITIWRSSSIATEASPGTRTQRFSAN